MVCSSRADAKTLSLEPFRVCGRPLPNHFGECFLLIGLRPVWDFHLPRALLSVWHMPRRATRSFLVLACAALETLSVQVHGLSCPCVRYSSPISPGLVYGCRCQGWCWRWWCVILCRGILPRHKVLLLRGCSGFRVLNDRGRPLLPVVLASTPEIVNLDDAVLPSTIVGGVTRQNSLAHGRHMEDTWETHGKHMARKA